MKATLRKTEISNLFFNGKKPVKHRSQALKKHVKTALSKSIDRAVQFAKERAFYTPPFYRFVPKYEESLKNPDIKYLLLQGGRGSGKSVAACCHLIEESFDQRFKNSKFIFGREIQVSIEDSVYSLVKMLIEQRQLMKYFRITNRSIINRITGVVMLFKGFRATGGATVFSQLNKLKGLANVKYIFVDEAQDLTEETINVLFPTVNRGTDIMLVENAHFTANSAGDFEPDTRFIFAMNANLKLDPIVAKVDLFIDSANDDEYQPKAEKIHMNIFDLPQEFQDKQLLEQAKAEESEIYYDHVWLGKPFYALSGTPFEDLPQITSNEHMQSIAFVDPSFNGGDFTAITFLGIQEKTGRLAAWGHVFPNAWDVCLPDMVKLITKYLPESVYYECNAIFGSGKTLFAQHGINAKPRLNSSNKEARIYRAASVVRNDLDLISNRSNREYINQVIAYSDRAKFDDAPDSLASACSQVVTQLKKAENQKWLKKAARVA